MENPIKFCVENFILYLIINKKLGVGLSSFYRLSYSAYTDLKYLKYDYNNIYSNIYRVLVLGNHNNIRLE